MNEKFQERLAEAMRDKRMRAVELSERSGIGKSSISMYLSGQNRPSASRTYKIAKILGVNEAWLLGFDVENAQLNNQSSYNIKLDIEETLVDIQVDAVSESEAVGIAMKLMPTATYENIIKIEEEL